MFAMEEQSTVPLCPTGRAPVTGWGGPQLLRAPVVVPSGGSGGFEACGKATPLCSFLGA